ncbi:calcium/proton exchanger [soil metagenome]
MAFFKTPQGLPYLLTPFIPLAIVADIAGASAGLIFVIAALGIIPTAALMGLATEELAAKSGPGIGGLLNVTFGNAPELIIALFALSEGLQEVVKASIIGSILGNILLVMGAAMFVGGLGRDRQFFNSTAANAQASMLLLAATAMAMPAIYQLVEGGGLPGVGIERVDFGSTVEHLSLIVSFVLAGTYGLGLLFSLKTHRDLFNPQAAEGEEEPDHDGFDWSIRRSIGMLAIAGIAVGVMSEILVGSISEASESVGLSEFFIGVIVVAIVGNAAEHWVAVLVARKNQMDLAVNIAIGSTAQVAPFVAPVLVVCSFFIGPGPMPLVFNGFELGGVFLAVLIAQYVSHEGESTWFEGAQLLAVYLVLGITFFYA